jgi:neutral ceramidase
MTTPSNPDSAQSSYQVGAATADITPPVGTPLAGNFRDDYASRGVKEPLRSRALVVRQGDRAVALIAADLVTAPDALVARVRQEVQNSCGLAPQQVMVAATHTHSGPAVEPVAGPDVSAAVIEQVLPGIVQSCVRAWESCQAMGFWATTTRGDGLFFNRRLRLRDGSTVMNWTLPLSESIDRELGPVDDQIGVLLAGRDRDHPAAVTVNAALHAAVLAGDNWLMNPDWPGYYYRAVRAIFGPDTTAMFLQGAEGNINHIDAHDPLQGRGFKEAQRIGSAVGLAAAGARFDAPPVAGPIAWSSQVISLPPRRITAQQRTWAERVVADAHRSGRELPGQVDGIPELIFARDQIELAQRPQPYSAEIQVFRIGDVAIVGLPGEFFVEFGLAIKRASPARVTLVVGLANGSAGYVPTAAAFDEGGYEPTAWRYSRLAPECGAICVESATRQIEAVFAG